MDWLKAALVETAERPGAETLATFQRSLDPTWIEEALNATGVATLRRRRLPSEQVIWLVLGMALLRDRPTDEVVSRLDLVMPSGPVSPLAKSSIAEARQRVGPETLRWLFQRCSLKWGLQDAKKYAWRGLSAFATDGTTLLVPDLDSNRAAFGLSSGGDRDDSGYRLAQARLRPKPQS